MEHVKVASNDTEYKGDQNVTFYHPWDNRDILMNTATGDAV